MYGQYKAQQSINSYDIDLSLTEYASLNQEWLICPLDLHYINAPTKVGMI